jgi:hypothetical protein
MCISDNQKTGTLEQKPDQLNNNNLDSECTHNLQNPAEAKRNTVGEKCRKDRQRLPDKQIHMVKKESTSGMNNDNQTLLAGQQQQQVVGVECWRQGG